MPTRPNGWYGWRADVPDHRDYVFHRDMVAKPPPLPTAVDLRALFPPCYNQWNLGSCTANAIAGVLEFDQRKQKQAGSCTPSRLFIYYNERVMEGTVESDAGAEIRDGIKSVGSIGAPPESDWKYIEKKFKTKPTKKAFADARKHPALKYARITQTVQAIRECLASGFPIVFGFTCYESFESDTVAKTGILNLPEAGEKVVGGHAVVCVGYDMATGRVLVRNSWDTDWGINGYFAMPFDYIANDNLSDDLWAVTQVA